MSGNHIEDLRKGDRRHTPLSQIATLVMLALQLAALVWGAATLKAAVDQLESTVINIGVDIRENQVKINRLELEQAILHDRQSREVK
jgi:hypothetical protein